MYNSLHLQSGVHYVVYTVNSQYGNRALAWHQQPDRRSIWHKYRMQSIVTDAPVTCYALSFMHG